MGETVLEKAVQCGSSYVKRNAVCHCLCHLGSPICAEELLREVAQESGAHLGTGGRVGRGCHRTGDPEVPNISMSYSHPHTFGHISSLSFTCHSKCHFQGPCNTI